MIWSARHLLVSLVLLAGCSEISAQRQQALDALADAELIPVPVFTASDAAEKRWRKLSIWGQSEFRIVPVEDDVAIRAETQGSSGLLIRLVDIDPTNCPEVAWTWQVETLPEVADLTSRASEDVAASVFLAFGDPGSMMNPQPVPTLRYAWATETNAVEEIIDSPYFPGVIRTLVVRSGDALLGQWVTERRNLVADFERAFGRLPDTRIEVFALFTDSDHGKTPIVANYRSAEVFCREAPDDTIFGARMPGPQTASNPA